MKYFTREFLTALAVSLFLVATLTLLGAGSYLVVTTHNIVELQQAATKDQELLCAVLKPALTSAKPGTFSKSAVVVITRDCKGINN